MASHLYVVVIIVIGILVIVETTADVLRDRAKRETALARLVLFHGHSVAVRVRLSRQGLHVHWQVHRLLVLHVGVLMLVVSLGAMRLSLLSQMLFLLV